MKIKFIKEYVAVAPDTNLGIVHRYRFGEVEEIKDYTAQWLIDNGFAEEVKELDWKKPNRGDSYYFINGAGVITSTVWMDNSQDGVRYLMGNYFRTTEAAKRYGKYLQAVTTVRQDEGVLTPDDVRKTLARDGTVYTIGINRTMLSVNRFYNTSAGAIYFDTGYNAKTSLNEHQDEWKIIVNYDWSRE